MGPGGTTESIAHFIGYLHLFEDPARSHQIYDGGAHADRSQPWSATPQRDIGADRSLEDLQGHRIAQAYNPGDFTLISVAKHKLLPPPPIVVPHPHLGGVPPVDAGPHDPALPSGDLTLRIVSTVDVVVPAPLPDQILADIHQTNVLHNNGVVLTSLDAPVLTQFAALHDQTALAPLPEMLGQAVASVPHWLAGDTQTASLIQAVATHDADTAAHGASQAAAPPGLYADGILQPAGTPFNPVLPGAVPDPAQSHDGRLAPGLDAQTGGNTAVNVASILDDHTQHTGLAVMGNVYTTDAIIQTNVLHSLADVMIGGAAGAPAVSTDGNTAHNLASFAQHDLSASFVSSTMPWAHLQVDTINGDFYDVKSFSQFNYISNNDVVQQSTASAFSEIHSGGNTQVNALPFSELAQNYDLIIVQGSFHNSNVILQQNVFLNDDVIRMMTGRGDTASQSVTTGDNTLANSASIDHYGATHYQTLDTGMAAWLARVESGSLDADGSNPLPSIGSSLLHALVIKGDFYDINFLSQTNIVSNADTVLQGLPNTGTSLAPGGVPTTSTMAVDAGHNQLANLASIAVVGTTSGFQFVGGQHYDDAILVQANLVSDKAQVTIGDTHTLASEVVAFTGLHDVAASAPDHVATLPADSSLHHDLFHGIMT